VGELGSTAGGIVELESGLFEIHGEVVRKNDYDLDNFFDRTPGMGIRFTKISDDARAQLKKMFDKGNKPA